ncbi:MAG: DUF4954 family protein [Bacteroidales bacterium]|nr:DUF4954 family protein [Bacteroidales bacterium]
MEGWRSLTAAEVEQLRTQQNSADNWDDISVVSTFFVGEIFNCHFSGRVMLGERLRMRDVHLLQNCHVEDDCVLFNIGEISGEEPPHAFPMEIRNEDGSHTVMAHPDMIIADAYLCSTVSSEHPLHQLNKWDKQFETSNFIGKKSLVKNVPSLKSVWIGECAQISEATQLENVFVHSSEDEPTFIGAGVILRNVILGLQNNVDTHTIVRNVLTGAGVSLSEGLRIAHCVVGDNSHLSCCEVLFSLIFPFHEQHHNSSFLIASTLKGQSNVASGATIGSNHNGRKNDCELLADRGFWPGLCSSVKFPSRFAAYTLLVKGDYPYEINLPYPFCLVSQNLQEDELDIMPAYWWRYNAFALKRNAQKFQQRDCRKTKTQHIHTEPLAPDTVQQIVYALNQWQLGSDYFVKGIENSKRKVWVLKTSECFHWYREMLLYYATSTLGDAKMENVGALNKEVADAIPMQWANLGGQLMPVREVRALLEQPSKSWDEMHQRYDQLAEQYEKDNRAMACFVLKFLCDGKPTREKLVMLIGEAEDVVREFNERAEQERARDLASPFRKITKESWE